MTLLMLVSSHTRAHTRLEITQHREWSLFIYFNKQAAESAE